MAIIVVTQDTPSTFVDTATHALTVTVDVTGVGFSVYCQVTSLNGTVREWKAVHGSSITFNIVKDDSVVARACGTGSIVVTTA